MKTSTLVSAGMVLITFALLGFVGVPTTRAGEIPQTRDRIKAQSISAPPWTWHLASDFRVFPNQANPNPDNYGDADTWTFMRSTTVHDPSTYALITQFYPNVGEQSRAARLGGTRGIWISQQWCARIYLEHVGSTGSRSRESWPKLPSGFHRGSPRFVTTCNRGLA